MTTVRKICHATCLVALATWALTLQAQQSPNKEPAEVMLSRRDVVEIIAETRKIVSPNGIEELVAIPVHGTTQWLSIRGRDRRNPVLLFLHGGPGSPTMPIAYTFQNPWEDYFTVVQWDQRGSGKTFAASDPKQLASALSMEQMTADAEAVIRHLLKHLGKQKIFLLGHSWGSALGVAVAQKHPEWLHAYLGVGQMVNTRKNEEDGYAFALAEAKAHGNAEAERELRAIAPYPGKAGTLTFERIGVQRKWLVHYGGLTYGRSSFSYDANARLLSPDYTQKEVDGIDKGGLYSLTHLLGALENLDFEKVTTFQCPIFLFEGRHDYATSHRLAATWFRQIKAPTKRIVWFEHSAHMVMQEEPGRFLYHLVADLRPLAQAGDAMP